MKRTRLLTLLLTLLLSLCAAGQTEFMIYGTLKVYKSSAEGATITVTSDKKQYGRVVKIDSSGQFRVWLAYAKNYVVTFQKEGLQTVSFEVSTKMPNGVIHCCFTPFDMSFRMFKPDGKYDSLFRKPIVKIQYEPRLKSYNYSLDIDYFIQKMAINAELEKQRNEKNALLQAKARDSIEKENQYLSLVMQGNTLFEQRRFVLAQVSFEKALQMKPMRLYPKYKLEDIKTELEIFAKRGDTLRTTVASKAPENKPADLAVAAPVYKRKTPAELEAMFRKDLHKQIVKETKDPKVLAQRVAFVANVMDKKVDTTKPAAIAVYSVPPGPVVAPFFDVPPAMPQFNEIAYQDSLREKYPAERTVEIIKEDTKTTTKVVINRDGRVSIYLKVDHLWGATFFFIDNTPYPMENISKSFFEVTTKLLSERGNDSLPATEPPKR